MYNTILFDMDGTLIDSGPGVMRCIKHALTFYGINDAPESELKKCVGPPLSDTFGNRFKLPETEIMRAIEIYREEYHKGGIFECTLYPGIVDCLKTLNDKGFKCFVTSSKHDKACRIITDHFGITDLFYDIVGSSADASRETKTEVLEACFTLHPDIKKEESVLIGDTVYDAKGAEECNLDFIGVTYGFGSRESLLATNPVTLLDTTEEITNYLLSGDGSCDTVNL